MIIGGAFVVPKKEPELITPKQRAYLIGAYKRHGIKQAMPTLKSVAITEIDHLKKRDANIGYRTGGRR